jgi:hypothetical protein
LGEKQVGLALAMMAGHRAAHCPSVGIISPPRPTCVPMAFSTSTVARFRFARTGS